MLIVIDIGNTNTVCGLYQYPQTSHSTLVATFRFETSRQKTTDEYIVLIQQLLALHQQSTCKIQHAIIASVVPPLTPVFAQVCAQSFLTQALIVDHELCADMPILCDQPKEVGADRIVNAIAAFSLYQQSVIVVDLGTATTFDVISQYGEYLGGAIVPGIGISLDALFSRTSKLPRIDFARPSSVIGKNTTNAIQAGLFYGYVGLIDSLVLKIQQELGQKTRVIATGGLARLVASDSKTIEECQEFLTLNGLQIIWKKYH